jgi:hypothetical protein
MPSVCSRVAVWIAPMIWFTRSIAPPMNRCGDCRGLADKMPRANPCGFMAQAAPALERRMARNRPARLEECCLAAFLGSVALEELGVEQAGLELDVIHGHGASRESWGAFVTCE